MRLLCIALGIGWLFASLASAQVRIHEFSATNRNTIADEDGEYSDWIELVNPGRDAVSLDGWFLTDDPDDLTRWKFPAVEILPGDYLVVFASGKNRVDPASELHTSFALDSVGEYLALVAPGGERIEQQFSPAFPPQDGWNQDVSYGAYSDSEGLVNPSSTVEWIVPDSIHYAETWKQPDFQNSAWNRGVTPLGFGDTSGQFEVTVVQSRNQVASIADAEEALSNPLIQRSVRHGQYQVINFNDNASDENYEDSDFFPGHSQSSDVDDFVLYATASVFVPHDGTWTFGINSDDGARLRVNGTDVIVDDNLHAPRDTLGTISLESGNHEIELLFFERGGGAAVELFAAFGFHTSFSPSAFRLVGVEWANGIIHTGFQERIETDLATDMLNQNSTVLTRSVFFVDDILTEGTLELQVLYSDGFVAWVNGTEIVRRNAPDTLTWNSRASEARPVDEVLTPETIRIPVNEDLLVPGLNVLAIQGLNHSPRDPAFLLSWQLRYTNPQSETMGYFTDPTPGAANGAGIEGRVGEVALSQDAGFYDNAFDVTLTHPDPQVSIRYTTDGTEPTTENGTEYQNPVRISTTTTLRVKGFREGWEPGASSTRSYIFLNDVITQTRPSHLPSRWGGNQNADYDMDPDVVDHPDYRDAILDDLKSIPTVSLVMDPDDWFSARDGIYTHTEQKGLRWERPGSVELIYPDEREGFQVNAGLRIQGGYSRKPGVRKHSIRMLFRNSYGPARLEFPLFNQGDVTVFDTLVLRGGYNYSWHANEGGFGSSIGRADYIRDEFSRRTQFDMGQPAARGTYVHVYLNGLYWGLYNWHERPDEAFSSDTLGGEKDEWDVVTGGTRGTSGTRVKSGNKDAWNEMISLASQASVSRPQVLEDIEHWVNLDNLIDYMLAVYFTGNRDAPTVIGGSGAPWNFYSSRRQLLGYGYHFYLWDSEWSLEEPSRNVIEFHDGRDNPAYVFQRLRVYPEFRVRVADRIQKHFFNDGALTTEQAQQRYQEIASIIDRAIVGESARWGDLRSSSPRLRSPDWTNERDRILNTYLSRRSGIVLDQLRQANLYPDLVAPQFNQHGGPVDPGFALEIRSELSSTTRTELFGYDSVWNYEHSGQFPGAGWTGSDFSVASWSRGRGLFYVENSALPETKHTALTLGQTTYYFRSQFSLTAEQLDNAEQFTLSTIVDDGAIVYINGQEAFRIGMPGGAVDQTTFAYRTVGNAGVEGPFPVDASLFREGTNIVAVEVHQTNSNSSDIVFGMELEMQVTSTVDEQIPVYYTMDGSDPRLQGGSISDAAILYESPQPISESVRVRARTFDGNSWSALTDATFDVEAPVSRIDLLQAHLRISELMYDPADDQAFEFIELHNTHPNETLSLSNVGFTDGVAYTFPVDAQIPPHGYVLLTSSQNIFEQQQFRDHYGLSDEVLLYGPYDGRFSNGGETVELRELELDERILSLTFNDNRGWPLPADGSGHSMVPVADWYDNQPGGGLDYSGSWKASALMKGSPGAAELELQWPLRLSEVYHPGSDGSSGFVEMERSSNLDLAVGEWFLSTDKNDPFQIPVSSLLNDDDSFSIHEFEYSPQAGDLLLAYRSSEGSVEAVVDSYRCTDMDGSFAFGRVDASEHWVPTLMPTRGIRNEVDEYVPVLSEVMYHPVAEDMTVSSATAYEFIEVWNPTDRDIPLGTSDGPARIDGAVSLQLKEVIVLQPGERMVFVSFDPDDASLRNAFLSVYGDYGAPMIGPFSGRLSNRTERIQLEYPYIVSSGTDWVLLDEVVYSDSMPWPDEADGQGFSLHCVDEYRSGNDPGNWQAMEPTPGMREDTVSVMDWSMY